MNTIEKIKAEIENRLLKIQISSIRSAQMEGSEISLKSLLFFIENLEKEQPYDLASLISEATNVAKRIVDRDSFYNSLPQNLRNKYTFERWCEILEALSTMKEQGQQKPDLENEIKDYTETLYHDIFGNGQGTLDEFDWEDIVQVIDETARYFYNLNKNDTSVAEHSYATGWRLNKENNKPAVKQSVLMFTTHGIAEGEWDGLEWTQYRRSWKVKDSDVVYWMHLKDLICLEKEDDSLQQEQQKITDEELSMLLSVIREPANAMSESCHLALQSIYGKLTMKEESK